MEKEKISSEDLMKALAGNNGFKFSPHANREQVRAKLLQDAQESRSKFAMDICWLYGADKVAAVKEVRQMFIDLMDSVEQTDIDGALQDSLQVFDDILKAKGVEG